MKQYSIDDLKKYLLNELGYDFFCKDNDEKKYYEERFDILFLDLCDISKKELSFLNERDTFIIRKLFGLLDNGVFQTQESIGKLLNLSSSRIWGIKKEFLKKMSNLISYEIILSKKENDSIILSDNIEKLDFPYYIFATLHRNNIKNVEDLISLSPFQLSKITKNYEFVIEYVDRFDLKLKSVLDDNYFLLSSVDELNFSVKVCGILKRAGIDTIGKLISLDTEGLLKIKDMNLRNFNEISRSLNKYGVSLSEFSEIKKIDVSDNIEVLGLSAKTYMCLKIAGIDTIDKLISLDVDKLLKIRNMGLRNVNEISIVLYKYGLSLSKSYVNESLNKKSDLNIFVEPNQTSEFDCISKHISFLDKYKSLLLEKKQLQHRLNEIDMEIMNLIEQRNKEYTENIKLRK